MNPYALLIAVALAFGAGWQVQDWRWTSKTQAQEIERHRLALESTREARRIEAARSLNIQEAQNAATIQRRALLADADSARTESDRLRGDIAAIAGRLPSESESARTEHARAAGELLTECSRGYQELAGKADGHASDAVMVLGAWPR